MSLDVNISEPDEFNCNELHGSIKDAAELKGIPNFGYHVDYISGKGANYIANIFRVFIKEVDDENNNFSVIVKTLVNTTRQELFFELHKREAYIYSDVIPLFKSLQDSNQITDKVVIPECILSSNVVGNEVLILEDMSLQGYRMDNNILKYNNLELCNVELVLTELAKFHALSFICEDKEPDKYSVFKSKLGDIIFQDAFLNKSKLRNYFSESFNMSLENVTDVDTRNKLRKIETKLLEILKFFTKPRKSNVLCHGDFWTNNMLFKIEEDKPTRISLIDFQAMRYTSPVSDIIYFLYLCTDSNFRSKNFDTITTVYYESLTRFLKVYSLDVDSLYPKQEYEIDLEYFKEFGLVIAMIELRITTMTHNDDEILKDSELDSEPDTSEVSDEINIFKIRVNDVVKESMDNGTLDKLLEKVSNF